MATKKHPGGRPSDFTQEIADEICSQIAEGKSLREITDQESMPSLRAVMNWLRGNDEFVQQYARAKEVQADTYEDMMINTARTEADVQRARLIVDTMKWTASKLKPKKYGDKVDLTSDGEKIQPILVKFIGENDK